MLVADPRIHENQLPLIWNNSLLPGVSPEDIQWYMTINGMRRKRHNDLWWVGIDPEKQDFLSLKTTHEVVAEEEFRVQVRLPVNPARVDYEMAQAGSMVDTWLPRHSVQIESGRITAVTRSLRDDILYLNGPGFYEGAPRQFLHFDPSALAVEGGSDEE